MRIYKEVSIVKIILDKKICDICGEEITTENFMIDDVKIKAEAGVSYFDGGSYGRKFEIDCHFKCFEEKILPLIRNVSKNDITVEIWDQ